MFFSYLNKFSYLSTFVTELVHSTDKGGPCCCVHVVYCMTLTVQKMVLRLQAPDCVQCSVWPCWSYFTRLISVLYNVLYTLMYSQILFSGI